jgi:hypothetical protein
MFKLFSKKSKEEKFIAPEIKVHVLILSLMNSYLEQCKGDMVLVKEEPDLEKEFKRLESLGLSNTENAKLLKTKLDEIQSRKDKSKFGKNVLDWIVEMKKEFPNSYLVSFDQFEEILKDYGLVTNFLNKYVGIIPSSNISEIECVTNTMKGRTKNIEDLYLNKPGQDKNDTYSFFHYIEGVRCRKGEEKNDCERVKSRVEEIGNIIAIDSYYKNGSTDIRLDKVEEIYRAFLPDGFKSGPFDDFELVLKKMKSEDLMIAAPRNCFSTEFKISQMPVDPIVFQCCPYGVVIHSVWGEEADDKVLEEYKTLNQKILSM